MTEKKTVQSSTACVDCRVCTIRLGEDYMVYYDVWQQAGMSTEGGMLCIGCLENRLGRRLTACDFTDAQVNNLESIAGLGHLFPPKSKRLRARLTNRNNGQGPNTPQVLHVQVTRQEQKAYLGCTSELLQGRISAEEALEKARALASELSHKLDGLEAELRRIRAATDWLLQNDLIRG
jgi:hypothetical protein